MDVEHVLGPDGPVAARLARYEVRPEQLSLAREVDDVMRLGGRLLAEAGTGVGKSFAYLVPAVSAAAERRERVVVATHTIALQEQLLDKDLPFLSGILPAEFSVVLAKGRGNFLCLRRLGMAGGAQGRLFDLDGHERQLEQITQWARTTDDGTRQGLDFVPDGRVWSRVNAEAGNCLGRNCDHFDRCFYQAGRRRMQNADMLVTNHHFLFADMALRKVGWNLLPDFDHLVLDEAHAVEETAGSYLGLRVSSGQVDYLLRQLVSRTGKGLLATTAAPPDALDLVEACRATSDHFFADVTTWVRAGDEGVRRLGTPDLFELDAASALEALGLRLDDLADAHESKDLRQELAARGTRCQAIAGEMRALVRLALPGHVYWAEHEGPQGRNVVLRSAPIRVGQDLSDHLWQRLKSVTLTSATLATGGEDAFALIAGRLGLGEPHTVVLGSPFRFEEQARLLVDESVPDPREAERYETALPDAVLRHVRSTRGRAFVLFTSYQSMDRCHAACAGALLSEGYTVLKQGEGLPRGRMLEEFRAAAQGVLFGTDSFWQGVDVPGDALQNVIIARLPFSVPSHPLQRARTDAIRDEGGEPFADLALPQAILRFKQGFGRLIRSRVDTGRVVVLDRRLTRMRYGRRFLDALPPVPVEVVGNG